MASTVYKRDTRYMPGREEPLKDKIPYEQTVFVSEVAKQQDKASFIGVMIA